MRKLSEVFKKNWILLFLFAASTAWAVWEVVTIISYQIRNGGFGVAPDYALWALGMCFLFSGFLLYLLITLKKKKRYAELFLSAILLVMAIVTFLEFKPYSFRFAVPSDYHKINRFLNPFVYEIDHYYAPPPHDWGVYAGTDTIFSLSTISAIVSLVFLAAGTIKSIFIINQKGEMKNGARKF